MQRFMKSQSAVDYITSYGLIVLVIAIAVYAVLSLGIFNLSAVPLQCAANPSFACSVALLHTDGNLTFVLTQATGGQISINGVACSTAPNATSNLPAYGNIHVVDPITETGHFYNSMGAFHGTIYSGSQAMLEAICWGPYGQATGSIGEVFEGYIWINYTYAGLPGSYNIYERVAQFTAKYS